MRGQLSLAIYVFAVAVAGCSPPDSLETQESRSLPVVSGSELDSYVTRSEVPVLVEFGVDFQCERCRQMKTPIVELADKYKGQADIIRVDFNANAALVA